MVTKHYITLSESASDLPAQSVPSHMLCYYEWGDKNNKNVIFCVHGLTRNAMEFDYLASKLSSHYRIIAVDIVGRGESEWFEDKLLYNYTTYVSDCLQLLAKLDIKNVIWIGSSMGGLIAMLIAAKHPRLITHLILNDIGPQLCGKALLKIAKYVGLDPCFDNFEHVIRHCKMMYSQCGITSEEHWRHIAKHSVHHEGHGGRYKLHYDPGISAVIAKERAGSDHNVSLWEVWNKINIPILVMWGSKSALLLPSVAERIQNQDNVTLHTINDVGHTPSLMDNEQIEIIYSWLN